MYDVLHATAKFVFYFGIVLFLFYEFWILIAPSKMLALIVASDERQEASKNREPGYKEPEREWADVPSDERWGAFIGIIIIFYLVWTFLGLITGNWFVFASLLVLALVPKALPKAIKRTRPWLVFDAALSILLLGFALVNAYQLHLGWREVLHLLGL